jgi:hypothetical protein
MAANPQAPLSGASLSDILTAAKNLVIAVNNLAQTYLAVNGRSCTENIKAPTVIKSSPGRVASVSVTTAGSTTGMLYDATQIGVITAPLYVIPAAVGLYVVNLPTNVGLVAITGTGMTMTVNWS